VSATFSIWAPRASSAEVVIGDRRVRMEMSASASASGWFVATVDDAGPGTRYMLSIDGGDVRPDPRSNFQPEGLDGPSEIVDHGAFGWTDEAWRGVPLPSAVLYELHVGTFTADGTFEAAIGNLGHLADLGVDVIELMPVNEFPGLRGWGYDGAGLFAPHHGYGGPEGLKRLVDAAHNRGIAVVVDVVYNHLGPAGNHLGEFGPYFTDRYATPWGMAVNLDGASSDEVRRFFLDNASYWLREFHVDGLRVDAVHALVDTSATHFLEELCGEVERLSAELGRNLFLIAESDLNDPRVVARREVGGYGFDAQWSDDFHHALHAVLTGEQGGYYGDFGSLSQLATALRRAFVFAGDYSASRDRRHGRVPAGIAGWRFLGYLQNHDQIGNRAQGERSSQLLSPERLEIAAALVFTAPFVPMLFMGEEWGAASPFLYFTDHSDPDLARAVSEGRRREFAAFGWAPEEVPDPQDASSFERSKLDWDEVRTAQHARLLDWHRRLIALRRDRPELRDGRLDRVRVDVDEAARRITVHRGEIRVHVNLGDEPWSIDDPGAVLLASSNATNSLPGRVPPDAVVVFGDR